MCSQIFTERLKAFIFIIDSHFVPSKLRHQEGEILSVSHCDFYFLSLSFPLGALHESPVDEAWSIGVIPSCCFFSRNSPFRSRRFKELLVFIIFPVLPGGFSVSRTGQPKLPLLPEAGTEPECVYVNESARKESIFVLAQMDISSLTQAGHVQKAHLGKTKSREPVKFKI